MKKIFTLLCALALGLLWLLSSCGDGEALSPSERADRMVSGWDEAALNLYRYSGREIDYDGHDGYIVIMTPDGDSFPDTAALSDYQTPDTVRQCAGSVYQQLAACFAGTGEAYIIVAVLDGAGKVAFTFLNGEEYE